MTRNAISLVVAVLLLVGGWFGYQWYRDNQRTKHDGAAGKVEVFTGEVAILKDSLRQRNATLAAKDSALARANRPRPAGPTRIVYVHDSGSRPGVIRDSTAYVPQSDYDLLGLRYDSLSTAVTAYREAVGPALTAKDRVIAAQDSVIKYQKIVIDTPKPRRRWGLGISGGYGATASGGQIVTGPSVNVGVSYSF